MKSDIQLVDFVALPHLVYAIIRSTVLHLVSTESTTFDFLVKLSLTSHNYIFMIYTSQSHFIFFFPFPPLGIPDPVKPIPFFHSKIRQIPVAILPLPRPLIDISF